MREGTTVYQPQTRPAPTMPLTGAPAAPEIPLPPEPQSIEQTGLTLSFIGDLALKTLYLRGQMTMAELSTARGVPNANVIDKVLEFGSGALIAASGGPTR